MYVDGTNKTVAPVVVPPYQTRTVDSVRVRAKSSSEVHDSFVHVSGGRSPEVTYSSDATGGKSTSLLRAAIDAARENLEASHAAEIVDLGTAVKSRGLPLLPEEDSNGVLAQDVLQAPAPEGDVAQPSSVPPTAKDIEAIR